MVKEDLIRRCLAATDLPDRSRPPPPGRKQVKAAVECVFRALGDTLGAGGRVEIRRFGIFVVRPRKTGVARNPRTNQVVAIPPGNVVRFRRGKDLDR